MLYVFHYTNYFKLCIDDQCKYNVSFDNIYLYHLNS